MAIGDHSDVRPVNPTAGNNKVEHVKSTFPRTTIEPLELFQHEAEGSRRLAAQTVFLNITETFRTTFVPDLFASLERMPAYLDAAWELFKDAVDLEALDTRTRQIVALAITTNRSGTYLISAFPNAFRMSPMGHQRCDIILSLLEIFQAFSRYLSDVEALHTETDEIGHGNAR